MIDHRRRLVFIHIPKSGGTSLSEMLLRSELSEQTAYPHMFILPHPSEAERRQEIFRLYLLNPFLNPELTPSVCERINLVCGHFSYTMAEAFGNGFKRFAMFRDPLARVVSHLRDLQADRGGSIPLEDIYREQDSIGFRFMDNMHTRVFASVARDVESVWHDFSEVTEETLDRALENVSALDIAGITEHFADSVRILEHLTGRVLGEPLHLRHRRSDNPVSEALREEIEAHNHFDALVYEAAVERFRELKGICEAQGVEFDRAE